MTTPISLTGSYGNGTTADGSEVQADFDAIETFLNTTGVHVFQAGAVAEAALATSAVTAAKIAADAVTTAKILDSNVTAAKIASDAVTTVKILDSNVTTAKIADSNVTAAKIAAGAVTGAKLADASVAPRNTTTVAAAHVSSNITVSNPGTSTIGGATVVSGEAILLASQSTGSQNGPWIFNGSGSALTRPTWYDSSLDGFEGFETISLRGDHAGRHWRLATSGTITVDTTSTAWQMVAYSGYGTTANKPDIAYVASGGMYYDTTLSLLYASDGAAWQTLGLAAGSVADGAITSAKLADASVTDDKLADDAVAPRNLARIAAVHSTSNITISNPATSTFGGTTLVDNSGEGEFVLLVAQSTASQNGPWQFNGSGSALTRPSWYDNDATDLDAFEGMLFNVARGTWIGTKWRLVTTGAITVDTTSTSWQAVGYSGYDTAVNRPSATLIAPGGFYFDTTNALLSRSNGSSWSTLYNANDLLNHISDSTAAHAASAISASSTTLSGTATDVQGVLEELDNSIDDHIGDTVGAHAATAISFTPGSGIAATTVQAAIEEAISDWQATYDTLNVGKVYDWPGTATDVPTKHLLCYGQAVSSSTYSALYTALTTSKGSCTITNASPAVITCTAHGLVVGDSVCFTTTGSLPTGLSTGTTYYVMTAPTANTLTLGTTRSVSTSTNAVSVTTAINTSSSGSGTHLLIHAPYGVSGSNFYLPDYRGRESIGLDSMGGTRAYGVTGSMANVLGGSLGIDTVTLAISEMPNHDHETYTVSSSVTFSTSFYTQYAATGISAAGGVTNTTAGAAAHAVRASSASGGANQLINITDPTHRHLINPDDLNAAQETHTHQILGEGGGGAHNNVQSSLVCNKIIYTGV